MPHRPTWGSRFIQAALLLLMAHLANKVIDIRAANTARKVLQRRRADASFCRQLFNRRLGDLGKIIEEKARQPGFLRRQSG